MGHGPAWLLPPAGRGRREIVELGHEYGDDVDESGTVAAAVHRGWTSLKDSLAGDAAAVLKAVVTAVSEYEDTMKVGLSAGFREVVGVCCTDR